MTDTTDTTATTPQIITQGHDLPDTALILLPRGLIALIDRDDVPLVEDWHWSILQPRGSRTTYVYGRRVIDGEPVRKLLHRVLLDPPAVLEVDHINGNGLDCRRANLRMVTHAENAKNQPRSHRNWSGVKGVFWDPDRRKWRAVIDVDGERRYLGRFDLFADAAAAREAAETALHGEFIRNEVA